MTAPLSTFSVARRDGALTMEGVTLADVAHAHGTPLYVYSRAAIVAAYERWSGALRAARGDRRYAVCYAVKANSNLTVLNLFATLGAGFDIVSGGELARVLRAGGSADKIVFSGIGKTEAEMELALAANIKCFNVESEPELERLNAVALRLGRRAPLSLRVNPDVDARTHPYISTGLKNNKFGVAFDRALAVYRRAARMPGIHVVGIDCHIGSQLTEVAPLIEAMQKIVGLADLLADEGIVLQHICPGGGVGITYNDEQTIDIGEYALALQRALGDRSVELLLEPGRALVGNAGVLLTRVEFVKHTAHKNFLIVDAAMNDLIRPALYQAQHRLLPLQLSGAATISADVVGPICESADVLAYGREIAADAGELLALLSAGAYAFAMASNYNSRPRAAEVMVDGDNFHLIRRRESVEELFAAECIPLEAVRP